MSDKYDEEARELFAFAKGLRFVEVEVEGSIRNIAAALRKAADDEREACARIAQDHSRDFTLSDVCASEIADEIRARGAKKESDK